MNFHTTPDTPLTWTGEALAMGLFESDFGENHTLQNSLANLDDRLGGVLQDLVRDTDFKAKVNSAIILRVGRNTPIQQVILVGLGNQAQFNLETVRIAAAQAAKQAQKRRCTQLALSFPWDALDGADLLQGIVEGVELGTYKDNRFRSDEEKTSSLTNVIILQDGQPNDPSLSIERAQQICSGVILARELVAAPANIVTPITLAETAQSLAADYGMDLEILEQADCEARNMGSFLAVARASDLPPKFIHLTYRPQGTPHRKVAIVGKGLTFDSGGLNIKGSGSGMEMMKTDMGGAAAMLGAAKAIGQLKPNVEVHFISAVTQNMISGRAMRPGDILTASNGKTIEVNNTDAEGRLTLADALVFTEELGVDAIVDLATLTGASVVALGETIAGLWSTDNDLAQSLDRKSVV